MTEYRITVVGPPCVGKSALTNNRFVDIHEPTIQDCYMKELVVDGERYVLHIMDTTGLDDYVLLREQDICTGEGFLVVFSLEEESTLEDVHRFREPIKEDVGTFEDVHRFREKIKTLKDLDVVLMVLVGNKCDMEASPVDSRWAQDRAICYKCAYVETSAATDRARPLGILLRDHP
ncbi:hypothetical protein STEG23_023756 [Scotinomys teguina]